MFVWLYNLCRDLFTFNIVDRKEAKVLQGIVKHFGRFAYCHDPSSHMRR